jgi:hypothetical protein
MHDRRSPCATAQLLLINAKLYESERDREITRYRFSENTLRRISKRGALRKAFLIDLEDEIAELGWLLIPLGTEYAIMNLAKTDSWVKLSSKRLVDDDFLNTSEEVIEKKFGKLFPQSANEETEFSD